MTVFALLFLALFLAAVVTLIVAGVLALRGFRAGALARLRLVGMSAAAYMGVVVVVALVTPQRFLAIGDEQCSDDWCIAVRAVRQQPASTSTMYNVTFGLMSRARGVAQRERSVGVYLRDARGRRYDPAGDAGDIPFDTLLHAQETIEATRRFEVPAGADIVGLVVTREGGIPGPGCCIIGDEGSLLHKKTIVRLQ